MKALFLSVSYFCAVLLTALVVVITLKPEATPTGVAKLPSATEFSPAPSTPSSEQTAAEEDLMQAIIARHEDLDRKEQAIQKREADVSAKTALLTELQEKLSQAKQGMEEDLKVLDENERKNCKKLSEFYSKMEPNNAAQLLSEIEPERAALIMTFLSDRDAGRIMDAAVALGPDGIERAVGWSEVIRGMKNP